MPKWDAFLNSLITEGGRFFILLAMIVWLVSMLAVMHFFGKDPAEQGRLLMSNAFTSLFTTLMVKLGAKKD